MKFRTVSRCAVLEDIRIVGVLTASWGKHELETQNHRTLSDSPLYVMSPKSTMLELAVRWYRQKVEVEGRQRSAMSSCVGACQRNPSYSKTTSWWGAMMISVLMEKLGVGEASKHRRDIREREMVVSILEAKLDHLQLAFVATCVAHLQSPIILLGQA